MKRLLLGLLFVLSSTEFASAQTDADRRWAIDNGACIGEAHRSVFNAPVYIPPIEHGISNAFTSGFAQGQAGAAQRQVEEARMAVYEGCMASRGWYRQR